MRGAKKFLWMVKCSNSGCAKYDSDYAASSLAGRIVGKAASEVFPHLRGSYDPGSDAIQIRYRNFRGDELLYTADRRGAFTEGEHLLIRLAPSGRRIAFHLASIQNRSEVESQLSKAPQPERWERTILNRHFRKGTSSRDFKEIRRKYPDYQP